MVADSDIKKINKQINNNHNNNNNNNNNNTYNNWLKIDKLKKIVIITQAQTGTNDFAGRF